MSISFVKAAYTIIGRIVLYVTYSYCTKDNPSALIWPSEVDDTFKVQINNILSRYFCRIQYELAKIGAIHHVYYIFLGSLPCEQKLFFVN